MRYAGHGRLTAPEPWRDPKALMNRSGLVVFLALGLWVPAMGVTRPAVAADQTVWEIGQFDQSSAEFHAHVNFPDPRLNPTFTVGKSDPSKDWLAEQPGSANTGAGARPHPYVIVFHLTNPPRGLYRLVVAVILSRPRVPNLQIEINGKSGIFHFRSEERR